MLGGTQWRSPFELCHGFVGHLRAVGFACVPRHLCQGLVSRDRQNLIRSSPTLCQVSGGRFSETVGGAISKTCLVALVPEPVAEASNRKRLAILRHKKRQNVEEQYGR